MIIPIFRCRSTSDETGRWSFAFQCNRTPACALQAIKAAGKLGKIPVGGTDGSRDALESMAKGELNNTVFQDPVGEVMKLSMLAYLIMKKQPDPKVVDSIIWIPLPNPLPRRTISHS